MRYCLIARHHGRMIMLDQSHVQALHSSPSPEGWPLLPDEYRPLSMQPRAVGCKAY